MCAAIDTEHGELYGSVSHWNGITSVQPSKEVLRICFIRLQHLVAEYNPGSDLHITEPLYVLGTSPNFSRTITKLQWHFRILYCYFRTSQLHCRRFCIIVILPGVQKFQVTIMSIREYRSKYVLGRKHEEKRSLGKQSVDGILMKRILTTYDEKTWTEFSRLKTAARLVFFCKHGTGIAFFVKCWELFDNYYIFGDWHTVY